jgi:hypothetical protein
MDGFHLPSLPLSLRHNYCNIVFTASVKCRFHKRSRFGLQIGIRVE